jgi:DNA-binding transcriptional LysR family regulator
MPGTARRRPAVEVRVSGQVTFNGAYQMLNAALSGYGLAFLPEEMTQPHVEEGGCAA